VVINTRDSERARHEVEQHGVDCIDWAAPTRDQHKSNQETPMAHAEKPHKEALPEPKHSAVCSGVTKVKCSSKKCFASSSSVAETRCRLPTERVTAQVSRRKGGQELHLRERLAKGLTEGCRSTIRGLAALGQV
jgi:hypothetical protein